jgi:uncharacterized protein YukE
MTNDGTNVSPDELAAFAKTLRDRAGKVSTAADTTGGVDLGFAPYGTINQWFGHLVRDSAHETTADIRTLAESLSTDAATLDGSATDFRNRDAAKAASFRETDTDG